MQIFDLNSDWKVRWEELYCTHQEAPLIAKKKDGWLQVNTLPCDVHMPLIEQGIIKDPVIADNCFDAEWIESKSWWFMKEFIVTQDYLNTHNTELVIEGLDVKADLYLNGYYLGHQASSFYPFRKDVRDLLYLGTNELIIRLTCGLEYFSDKDTAIFKGYTSAEYKSREHVGGNRGDERRPYVRKPQYVFGWDWNPRIPSCGIMGQARLEAWREISIRDVYFTTEEIHNDKAIVRVEAEVENFHPVSTINAIVDLQLKFKEHHILQLEQDVFLRSGINYVNFCFDVQNPQLWWPNGLGAPHLYDLNLSVNTENSYTDHQSLQVGIRTIRLNTDRIDSNNRLFAFEVNGVRLFCKGGNFAPPDSIYARVTDQKYEQLISEAREANFNMLRLNGTNGYDRNILYHCCDKYGILVWQDFNFSNSVYPDEQEWFVREIERELDYQTRRLRNYASLALFCGNNEIAGHLMVYKSQSYWAGDKKPATPGGITLYNEMMPRMIRNHCPQIPYWNSSPYGGWNDMESSEYGDRHYWDCFMNKELEKRIVPEEYDKVQAKFVSEFGCVGPTKRSTLIQYYGSNEIDQSGRIWKLHTNTFEKFTTKPAIFKHYTENESLSLDEYLLYGGLFQGFTLGYAIDSMRIAEQNFGSLVWSFNDCWGEVGWSIIDYYLTRKIAYHFVKRGFASVRLIMREIDQVVYLHCMNDTNDSVEFDVEYGFITLNQSEVSSNVTKVKVKPRSKEVVLKFPRERHEDSKVIYFAKPVSDHRFNSVTMRSTDFKHLELRRPNLKIFDIEVSEDCCLFKITSDAYAHGVHFNFDDQARLSDEYFDLLPGEIKQVEARGLHVKQTSLNGIRPNYVFVRN